jgi:hypothetical protein
VVAGESEKILRRYIDADVGDEGLAHERFRKGITQLNVLDAGIGAVLDIEV